MSDSLQVNFFIPKPSQIKAKPSSKQVKYEKYLAKKTKKNKPYFKSQNNTNILSDQNNLSEPHPSINENKQNESYKNNNKKTIPPVQKKITKFPDQNFKNKNANIKSDRFSNNKNSKPYNPKPKYIPKEENKQIDNETKIEEEEKDLFLNDILENQKNAPAPESIFTTNQFSALPIEPRVLSGLEENNFKTMTLIQNKSIPTILKRGNCLIKSETGSGKTLCYLVPLLDWLSRQDPRVERTDGTLAVVLCPTRELCIQVVTEANKLVKHLIWIIIGSIMGGENIQKEKSRLRKGINILVATPGRLLYHLNMTESFKLDNMKALVIEESDRVLDMGFQKDLDSIINHFEKRTKFNQVQKILIAATFSHRVKSLSLKMVPSSLQYIGFETELNEKESTEFLRIDSHLKIPTSIAQVYMVNKQRFKTANLFLMLNNLQKGKIIVFLLTIDEVEFYYTLFGLLAFPGKIHKLHGDILQSDRTNTYFDFRKADTLAVLFATEVASRGLDFDSVSHTILFDVPNSTVDYCNIVGRTGRIDKQGIAILMLFEEEIKLIEKMKKQGVNLTQIKSEYSDKEKESVNYTLKQLVESHKSYKIQAKRCLVSFMRAYARLDKNVFHLRNLNQSELKRNFGLIEIQITREEAESNEYQKGLIKREKDKRPEEFNKRKVMNNRDLERMEFG